MKLLTIKTEISDTAHWRKLPAALCILSLLFTIALSAGATLPMAGSRIEKLEFQRAASLRFTPIEGVIDKVWVEYGVKVKRETGIRIHTRFSVKNALNVECVIQASVERSDGHSLSSRTNTYATKDGKKVLISKPFTPPFEPADYPDTRLFFPYWALVLEAENPNKMKLVVTLSSGGKEFARSATVDLRVGIGKVH